MSRRLTARALGVAITALVTASPAASPAQNRAYLALERGDLDGDGQADEVRVGTDGGVRLRIGGLSLEASLGKGTFKVADIEHARIGDAVVVLVRGRSRKGASGSAIVFRAAADIQPIWSGPIGPRGDGEWAAELALRGGKLYYYETRPDLVSCAGEPLWLYPRAFDFEGEKRFRPYKRKVDTTGAIPLRAVAAAAGLDGEAAVFVRASGATSRLGASSADSLSPPLAVDDSDPKTAWVDGRGGDGVGERLLFRPTGAPAPVVGLSVIAGHAESASRFREFARPSSILMTLWDARHDQPARYLAQLPAEKTPTVRWIGLPEPVTARCIEIEMVSVEPGKGRRGQLAISEARWITRRQLAGETDAALAERIAAGDAGLIGAARSRGLPALLALLAAYDAASSPEPRSNLVDALLALRSPVASQALARAALDRGTRADTRTRIIETLASLEGPGADGLLTIARADTVELDARLEAVAALEESANPELLIELAGLDARSLRRDVSGALSRRLSAEVLADAATAASAPGAEGDLWRAAIASARRSPGSASALVARLRARWSEITDYERRTRLLEGLAALPGGAADVMAWWSSTSGNTSETVAMRRAAVSASKGNPEAAELRLRALADADPEVRTRAIEATPRDERDATRLAELLTGDAWPMVRTQAAGALADGCRGPGRAALETTIRTDGAADPRRAAIASLLSCAPEAADAVLVAVLRDTEQPVSRRSDAALALGSAERKTTVPALLAALATARDRALDHAAERKLAANLLVALGRMRDDRARDAVLRASLDSAFPGIQAAAAYALGHLCSPNHPEAARRLAELARSPEREVALAARDARTRCR